MGGVGEGSCRLRGAGFGIPFPTEKFVRTIRRYAFEKVGERHETLIAFALVVQRPRAQEVELRAMVGEAVDLPVVELDRADRLVRGKAGEAFRTEAAIAAMALVLL